MQGQSALSQINHLVRRFFGFVTARPLSPLDQEWVASQLDPTLRSLFFSQSPQDQRHALAVAHHARQLGGADDVIVAALVHDVGKRHTDLGAIGRSVATILDAVRLPLPGRLQRYRDHGRLGADDLRRASAPDLAVEFAELHPGPAPGGQDASAWNILLEADGTS